MDNSLIKRQDAIDTLTENKEMINAVLDSLTLDYNTRRNQEQRREQINEDIETIKALPSAEPERKKGRWIYSSPNGFKCSECGGYLEIGFGTVKMNFCPNCGSYNGGDSDE